MATPIGTVQLMGPTTINGGTRAINLGVLTTLSPGIGLTIQDSNATNFVGAVSGVKNIPADLGGLQLLGGYRFEL